MARLHVSLQLLVGLERLWTHGTLKSLLLVMYSSYMIVEMSSLVEAGITQLALVPLFLFMNTFNVEFQTLLSGKSVPTSIALKRLQSLMCSL